MSPFQHILVMYCLHKQVQCKEHYIECLPKYLTDDIIEDSKNEQWDDEPRKYQANKKNGKQNNPYVL